MTLEELLEIIYQKRRNAIRDNLGRQHLTGEIITAHKIQGQIDAYTDIICLIESNMDEKGEK